MGTTYADRMYQRLAPRALEDNAVTRATVQRVELLSQEAGQIRFATEAVVARKRQLSSADGGMAALQDQAKTGDTIIGRLAIDLITSDCLRVRYAEGEQLPVNDTAMVVGVFEQAVACTVTRQGEGEDRRVVIATDEITITVHCEPYRLVVQNSAGERICGVGGPEKDHFCNWDAFNTGINRRLDDGRAIASECFDLLHDESIYGFGEQFIGLDKVGQTIDLDMIDALGVTTGRSYKNVPFFVSNKGYGVYFNHSCRLTAWVGSMSAADTQIGVDDDFLDYYLICGSIKAVLSRYTDITGKGVMPPAWTFGYWQSKISYSSAAETLEVARQMRANQIPCDVIHLDTNWFSADWYCDLRFDQQRFPDPQAYLAELADLGFKVSLWQLPYIPDGSPLFNDLAAVDGFVKRSDGSIYDVGICFTTDFDGIVGVVDYTNPAAVRIHQDAFRPLFRAGASVIKTDFGEDAPADGVYHDGTPGHRMHNLYPLLYNQAIAQVTEEETGERVVWARSAWAGSQRFPLHWGGDNSPNHFNLYPQLQGGLSFGLSGFQFWSEDIGGFLGETNDALLCRWMQVGMFLSHSRIHGYGDRELYKFSPDCQRICKRFIELRYRLLPYILAEARDCVARSLPLVRAMVVEYQDDPTVRQLGDQYLFGSHLLVAPIFTEAHRRQVYLPAGSWTDWWTGERHRGPAWITVEAGLDTIPLFLREGAIVPLGPVQQYIGEQPLRDIELRIGLLSNPGSRSYRIAHDDGDLELCYRFDGQQHLLQASGADGIGISCPSPDVRIQD